MLVLPQLLLLLLLQELVLLLLVLPQLLLEGCSRDKSSAALLKLRCSRSVADGVVQDHATPPPAEAV